MCIKIYVLYTALRRCNFFSSSFIRICLFFPPRALSFIHIRNCFSFVLPNSYVVGVQMKFKINKKKMKWNNWEIPMNGVESTTLEKRFCRFFLSAVNFDSRCSTSCERFDAHRIDGKSQPTKFDPKSKIYSGGQCISYSIFCLKTIQIHRQWIKVQVNIFHAQMWWNWCTHHGHDYTSWPRFILIVFFSFFFFFFSFFANVFKWSERWTKTCAVCAFSINELISFPSTDRRYDKMCETEKINTFTFIH